MRTVPYGESDLIVTLLTETDGKLGARIRGGRKPSKRVLGGIEPFHTLEVVLDDRGGELLTYKESRFLVVRERLVANLEAMEAAGTALRWTRHLWPTRHVEAAAWVTLVRLLDALDRGVATPAATLAMAGFTLLSNVGYALELERCIVCGRVCPAGAPSYLDATRGGIVCRSCGGRGRLLEPRLRALAAEAQRAGDLHDAPPRVVPDWLTREHERLLLAVLDDAMAAHGGVDPSK